MLLYVEYGKNRYRNMKKKKKLEKKVFLPKCKNELLMFNRENILKNARNKYHSKGGKKDC